MIHRMLLTCVANDVLQRVFLRNVLHTRADYDHELYLSKESILLCHDRVDFAHLVVWLLDD